MKTLDPTTLRLAALVEFSDDAIISQTLDGRIETWNRAAERLFGYTAEEAIGQSIDLVLSPEHAIDEPAIIGKVLTGQNASHFETVGIARTGARIPLSVTISPILTPDGEVVGLSRIARDISRQRLLEREAFRLAAIVDSSEDAIVSKDLNGIVQTWNKAAERLFGYAAEEVVGRSITLIIPAERRSEEDDVLARVRAGRAVEHFETIRRRKDGSMVEISLSVSPIRNAEGTIIGASKIARDVAQQRLLTRQLADANRAKDEFLATLSHELRTPLNAVLGYTRMLQTQPSGEEQQKRFVETIERNARLLAQLVSDVLDVSSIVTGKIQIKPVPCDLAGVVAASVEVVRPAADAKGVVLQLQPSTTSLPVSCDSDRMQQVYWNLLSNAIKFTPRGGHIDVRTSADAEHVRVDIADTGVGLSRESLQRVFERFWQADSGSSRHAGGLGLGLALARHFVELHGGTVTASSEGPGHGSTFTVTLPLAH